MLNEPARMTLASSEWESFANIRDAVRDSETEACSREAVRSQCVRILWPYDKGSTPLVVDPVGYSLVFGVIVNASQAAATVG